MSRVLLLLVIFLVSYGLDSFVSSWSGRLITGIFQWRKRKYPGPTAYTCLLSVESCLVYCYAWSLGLFCFVLMIPEPWWIDSVRVRTAWLDSLFLENILDLEQTTRLSFISLGHKYWSFIYPQTQLCWGREKKKKKKKEKCGWKQFTHTNWWETRAIRKSLQHTIYDTIRLVYTHNIIIDILHTHTHSHTTVSPYQPHRWNQPRQVVLASQQLESGCVTNYPPWAWMRPNRGASTVHPLTIPRKWLTAAAAENGA